MQFDALLRKAALSRGEAQPGSKAEKVLEVAQLSKLWAEQKEECPLKDWFPEPLQQNWQWIPTAVKGSTQNLLLLFHGLGDTPGTDRGGQHFHKSCQEIEVLPRCFT